MFLHKQLNVEHGVNLKFEAALEFYGGQVLAVTDEERVEKPKLPKKRLLKKSLKRRHGR
jgi:hypothetical protein